MDRREFLLGYTAMAATIVMPINPLVLAAAPGCEFGSVDIFFDDSRLLLPDTNRFRYLSDGD